jgi:hypothetical protein
MRRRHTAFAVMGTFGNDTMEAHRASAVDPAPAADSLPAVADRLAAAAKELRSAARTEEDLRVGFEKLLGPILDAIGVTARPQYERSVFVAGRGGRADAVHGQVIIEYEGPGAFASPSRVEEACRQLLAYIEGEARARKDTRFLFDPKLVGVGFDGEQIFFVHYCGKKGEPKARLEPRDFSRNGPYPFNPQAARTLLTYMRALSRPPGHPQVRPSRQGSPGARGAVEPVTRAGRARPGGKGAGA